MPFLPPETEIRLGALLTLRLTRDDGERMFLVSVVEHGQAEHTTTVRMDFATAMKAARFLARIVEGPFAGVAGHENELAPPATRVAKPPPTPPRAVGEDEGWLSEWGG